MIFLTSIAVAAFILSLVLLLFLRFFARHSPPQGYSGDRAGKNDYKTDKKQSRLPPVNEGIRGEPHTCPVCAAKFEHGETVRSKILPPTGRNDRLLHISGCIYCLSGERRRECPVCGAELSTTEYLTARIFKRPLKNHIHIVGCNHCRLGKQKS